MRILLIGEASYLHNTLKKGLIEDGHQVVLMSDGNNWHNSPRDIDLKRDMRWGKLSGLKVLWQLLRHYKCIVGNDIVQIHNYQFVPLKMGWNRHLISFLKRHNRYMVKGCFGDDPVVLDSQAEGVPEYSDTYWDGRPQNVELNRERTAEMNMVPVRHCSGFANRESDALVACLYEYYLCYRSWLSHGKLHYIPLPIEIPEGTRAKHIADGRKLKVLVGIQPKRDYLKGAAYIGRLVEQVAKENDGLIEVNTVEGVPYDEYCRMLSETDVLVDQLYSYTPSMNSLAAMARGTVVIGGGEEEFYKFIGEEELRPIINVRPGRDEDNLNTLRRTLTDRKLLEKMSQQSIDFVKKYHDYRKVARQYEHLYERLLAGEFDIY